MALTRYANAPLLAPFTEADFRVDPGYRFALQQGEEAIDRASIAAGRYDSGAVRKALQEYNQGLADQQYQQAYQRYTQQQSDIYSRLSGVAGQGQQAAGQIAQYRQAEANQLAALLSAAGSDIAGLQTGQGQQAAALLSGAGTNIANLQLGQGQQAATLLANAGSGIAGLQMGQGQQAAALLGSAGTGITNLQTGKANQLATLLGSTGINLANLQVGQGANLARLYTDTATVQANAQLATALQAQGIDANTAQQLAELIGQSASTKSAAVMSQAQLQNALMQQQLQNQVVQQAIGGGGGGRSSSGGGGSSGSRLGQVVNSVGNIVNTIAPYFTGDTADTAADMVDAYGNVSDFGDYSPALTMYDMWGTPV